MTEAIDDAMLEAFLDGELPAARASGVRAALAGDPVLAARLERLRNLSAAVKGAYAGIADEPPPDRLLATISGTPRSAQVISLAERRAAREPPAVPPVMRWGALAASLVLAFVAGRMLVPASPALLIAPRTDGRLAAQGALAHGLQQQLASNQAADAPVRIGVSFQAADGQYCRTFRTRQAAPIAGLACRDAQGWQVRMAVQADKAASQGVYQTAASDTPAPVLELMDQLIQGQALDAAAEAKAKAAGWRTGKP